MNLSAYDPVNIKVNKQKTWIYVKGKQLVSKDIKFRPYSTLTKRYDNSTKSYKYYIVLLDDTPKDRIYRRNWIDDYGRIKVRLGEIWEESGLNSIKRDTNVDIVHIEQADDGDIYLLNL